MDAIRSKQISEALNYDKNANAMVFNLEKKRTAAFPDRNVIPGSQADTQLLGDVGEQIKFLSVALDKKYASLAQLIRPGRNFYSQEYAAGATDVGEIELILQGYNKLVSPFTNTGLTPYLRQQIVVRIHDLLKPVARMITGLKKT